MEFLVRDKDGNEHGPVDQETLKKWVEEDRITAETEIRNSLLGSWKKAEKMDFLKNLLVQQAERISEVEDNIDKTANTFKKFGSRLKKKEKKQTTAFIYKYIPNAAPASRRMLAFLWDFILIAFVALFIFGYGMNIAGKIAEKQTGSEELRKEDVLERKVPAFLADAPPAPPGAVNAADAAKTPAPATPAKATKPVAPAAQPKTVTDKAKAELSKVEGELAKAEEEVAVEIQSQSSYVPWKIPDNLKAVSAPSIYADSSNGYYMGAIWLNSATNQKYVCLNAKEGAARWIEVPRLRKIVTRCTIITACLALLYFGISLGYFAQSFGMWYWGIFIVKKNVGEVFFFRAFLFSFLMMLIGIVAPLFVYLFGRAPHDILSGVKVIQVAGSPPAG